MPEFDVVIVPHNLVPDNDDENGELVDNRPNRDQERCRLWMFSPLTGEFMEWNNKERVLECPSTFVTLDYDLVNGFKVKTDSKFDRYRKEYDLDPLVKDYEEIDTAPNYKRATVEEVCEKCEYNKMEYFTMQLRSADEGQTVFYECPKCGHRWRTNN